jgi:nucleoside-diphosphate-sugar epimerase
MKVVVTGSSGLLGRHVAAALAGAGHTVIGVDTQPPTTPLAAHFTVDLTDLGEAVMALRGAEAVVHAAAIPRPTGHTPDRVFHTNVAATYNVVEAALIAGTRRLVYASSFSVLGYPFFERPFSPRYFPIDEAHPAAPQDAYALSKWLGEEIIEAAVRRRDLTAVSLRMPWIQTAETFPRDVVPRRASDAEGARNMWSYLDARDAGLGFLRAVEAEVSGHRRFYLSAADSYMDADTEPLVRAAYPGAEIRRPIAGNACVFDLAAAAEGLGWTPRHRWRDYY